VNPTPDWPPAPTVTTTTVVESQALGLARVQPRVLRDDRHVALDH
jgi:hypothetical protein